MAIKNWPTKCEDVTFDMGDGCVGQSYDAKIGDLIWDFKMGGHIIVAELLCGTPFPPHFQHEGSYRGTGNVDCSCGGYGTQPCTSFTLVCECGEDGSWRDHHYELLARNPRLNRETLDRE